MLKTLRTEAERMSGVFNRGKVVQPCEIKVFDGKVRLRFMTDKKRGKTICV